MKRWKKIIAFALVFSILFQGFATGAKQAKKATLRDKKMSLKVGQKATIRLKNKNGKATYRYKSSHKRIATVSKKGRVHALRKGKTRITVTEIYRKKPRNMGTVTVSVSSKKAVTTPAHSTTAPATPAPGANTPPSTATTTPSVTATPATTPAATTKPTAKPTPSPTPIGPAEYAVPGDFDKKKTSVSYGTKKSITYFSKTTNKDRKANIILPAGYTTDKKYPVLYLLHGISGDENEWFGGNPQYIIGNLVAQDLAKEMIVVVPNCRARENDAATSEFSLDHYAAFDRFRYDLVENLMPYMKENYSVAEGRENTAVAGFSMGGRESLNIGMNLPELFGYTAAFSPGYGVFAYEANGVKEEGLFTEDTFRLPEEYKNNTLLLMNNGSNEGGENAIGGTCHKLLTRYDIPHIFYVTEGGHEMKVWKHGLYNFVIRIFK